jgi:hypothetical protein
MSRRVQLELLRIPIPPGGGGGSLMGPPYPEPWGGYSFDVPPIGAPKRTTKCEPAGVQAHGELLISQPARRKEDLLHDPFMDGLTGENWAGRAAELGWNAATLFGCRRARPLDHPGGAGLLCRRATICERMLFPAPLTSAFSLSKLDTTKSPIWVLGESQEAGQYIPSLISCGLCMNGVTRSLRMRSRCERSLPAEMPITGQGYLDISTKL